MNITGHRPMGLVSPTQVQAYAGRTLDLLHAIEKTLEYLAENREHMRVLSTGVVDALKQLQLQQADFKLDPEGRVYELFASCEDAIARMYQSAQGRRESALGDARLRPEDGVAEACDALIAALHDAHDVVHELKEWIKTHDTLLEQSSGGTYTDVGELFRAMGIRAE